MDLQSKRLILKETDWDDLTIIHALHCEPQVEQFNTLGIPGSPEVTRAVIAGPIEDRNNRIRTLYEWTVRLEESSQVIGVAGISLGAERFRSAEIHYSLFPEFWGNGYAYEALFCIMKFCFKTLGLHRIYAGVAVENSRSIKLLEKLGMQREGRGEKFFQSGVNGWITIDMLFWKMNFREGIRPEYCNGGLGKMRRE